MIIGEGIKNRDQVYKRLEIEMQTIYLHNSKQNILA